ncbi:MAG: cell division protein FtsH, partial [Patescibacteria group bacterium]
VLDLPDINDREEILKIHAKNKRWDSDVNLRVIAERTPGFSGADLANVVNEAAILAARQARKSMAQSDIVASIEKVMLGPERKSHILTPKEKEIVAYHEAGHALVAASLKHTDPVHKISIVARGRAGGHTWKLPSEDRHLFSRSYFMDELAVAMGGYAAEKEVFNEITTGPHNDLELASNIARDLVTRYGMSEKLGPTVFGERQELVFLGKEIGTEKNYSEEIARLIDREVRKVINLALKRAKEILVKRRMKLETIAKRLMEKETIEREEFEALMAAA